MLGFQGTRGGLKLEALPGTGDYLSLVMQFILAFGICFLLPVLMLLLERAGIVSRAQLVRSRRYVIVGITVVAALLTPPDVISQLLLAVPMLFLFEGTLLFMWFTARRAKNKVEAEPAPEPSDSPSV
jgi:sec-independent protein translocase protein TatC